MRSESHTQEIVKQDSSAFVSTSFSGINSLPAIQQTTNVSSTPSPTHSDNTKSCPYCAETIKAAAIVCRFCQRDLNQAKEKPATVQRKKKSRMPRSLDSQSDYPVSGNEAIIQAQRALDDRDLIIYNAELTRSKKSLALAYLLCIFLGATGAHKFYIGRSGSGTFYLIMFLLGICTAWMVIGFLPLGIVWFCSFIDLFLLPSQVREAEDKLRAELYGSLR